MFKAVIALFALLLAVEGIAQVPSKLLDAIAVVESGNKADAVGDGGKSVGAYQIGKLYVDDVNAIYGTDYKYSDRTDPKLSREITLKYLTHYGKVYTRKTKKQPTAEVYARIHNGGPNGWKKPATIKYWRKVQNVLRNRL